MILGMKTLLLLLAVAAAWWYYRRQHPQAAAPTAQAVDNAATRYASSLGNDEKKAAEAVQKMNAGIGQTEKAVGEAARQQ